MSNTFKNHKIHFTLIAVIIVVIMMSINHRTPSATGTVIAKDMQTQNQQGRYSVSSGFDGGAYIIDTVTGELWYRKGFVFQHYGTLTEPSFKILTVTRDNINEDK